MKLGVGEGVLRVDLTTSLSRFACLMVRGRLRSYMAALPLASREIVEGVEGLTQPRRNDWSKACGGAAECFRWEQWGTGLHMHDEMRLGSLTSSDRLCVVLRGHMGIEDVKLVT